jgi:hypothetical protein
VNAKAACLQFDRPDTLEFTLSSLPKSTCLMSYIRYDWQQNLG